MILFWLVFFSPASGTFVGIFRRRYESGGIIIIYLFLPGNVYVNVSCGQ